MSPPSFSPVPPPRAAVQFILSNEKEMQPSMSLKHSPSANSRASSELTLFKQDTGIQQGLASQPRRLSIPFNLCNAIFGIVGLILATCFGVVTIVQTNTANREARLANQIAWNSMILSGLQTCIQSSDLVCRSFEVSIKLKFLTGRRMYRTLITASRWSVMQVSTS
ncbi:hypothetical protein BGZ57DRAFT_875961 [Hyaloscypha finlandica]|nr:hypothetical protein BGZ57DRAFT_875961 [Hyaloscypha finlandica]